MRTAPKHLLSALRAYDADTTVRWVPEMERWMLVWKGRDLFTLDHFDRTPMISLDGYTDEVMEMVKRSDNYEDGPDRLRAMERRSAEHRRRAELAERADDEELHKESREILRVMDQGVTPFVPSIEMPKPVDAKPKRISERKFQDA